jgi:predicted TIM-barrel fold metal-dependent hydrolase
MIVDAHHHLWELSQKKHVWLEVPEDNFLGDLTILRKDYPLQNYLQDNKNANIVKSVHVQAGWNISDPVGETAWLQVLADQYGFPHGIVAFADFTSDNVDEILAEHCRFPNVRGIRQILNWHTDPYFSGCDKDYINMPIWQKNFGLLEKYNLSFDLQAYPTQNNSILDLAKRYPNIQLILNHAGMPLFAEEVTDHITWRNGLDRLAQLPNIAIKISGFGMFDHDWKIATIKPLVLEIIDIFGIDRCMFASNFPVDGLYSDFDVLYNAFEIIMKHFSITEKQKFFHDNAVKFYRL